MKREIKFRMWNNGEMIYAPHYLSSNLSPYITLNGLFYVDGVHQKDMTLMQFTGLLDKTGKEIFEGDILRSEECLYEYGDKTVVFFYKGSFCGSFDYDVTPFNLSDVDMNEFEVVGNIFENQELLK